MATTAQKAPRVFIVHRWDGSPEADWYPWLQRELEKKGCTVIIPAFPNPSAPTIAEWLPFLSTQVGTPDKDTYFIGHSIGCQTIIRYLATLPPLTKIGGAIFVAGWFHLSPLTMSEPGTPEIANPWIKTPVDLRKARVHTVKILAIFSNDDPYVPLSEARIFEDRLGAQIIVEEGKGHFNEESGVKSLPVVLRELLVMIGTK